MIKRYLSEVVLLTKSYNAQDLVDWLHWHLNIVGFNHCHIFDNESIIDVRAICEQYGDRVSYERIVGWPNQYTLYNRYINNESKAWWVLPIDDDEFLYISDRYSNNVNKMLLDVAHTKPAWMKLCIGWRNLFPVEYIERRLNNHLLINSCGWSNEASAIWQCGNRPVKTFVNTVYKYDWADRDGHHRTHNPFVIGYKDLPGYTFNNEAIYESWQDRPTTGNEACILYHYQFKCNAEWVWKSIKRVSAALKTYNKRFPELYSKLYNQGVPIYEDNRMRDLWMS